MQYNNLHKADRWTVDSDEDAKNLAHKAIILWLESKVDKTVAFQAGTVRPNDNQTDDRSDI